MMNRKKTYLISSFLSLILQLHNPLLLASPGELLPTLPIEIQEARFNEISKAFEERWGSFSKDRNFASWNSEKSDDEILKEYDRMDRERRKAWYVDPNASPLVSNLPYMIAQDLLAGHLYRNLNCIAFDYNKTDSSYNSSTVVLDGLRFLALEAPKPEHMTNFLILLLNHRVTQLVRLTPAYEKNVQMSSEYWLEKTSYSEDEKMNFINVPQSTQGSGKPYQIPYFIMDKWLDYGTVDLEAFLELVLKVKSSYCQLGKVGKKELIAVHCSSGVSRTGTFIAAFLLVNEIDEKVKKGQSTVVDLSIERTVSKVSLLRPHAVGKPNQYLTLYKLVGLYLKRVAKDQDHP